MIRSIIRPETWVSCGYDGTYFWLHKSAYTEVGVTGGHEYRTRIAFRAPRMSLGGGKNVTVSQAVLRLTSVTDASNTLTAQSTYGANWGFSDTWATYPVTITGNATTETDVTPPAEIAGTFGSWDDYVYYHLSYVAGGDNTLVRLASYDTATPPELIVTWDYAENTIHTDTVEATAGVTSVTWTITPGADDARYVLAYRLGTATGTVYDGSGTSITWTPPYSVAEGIPDAASGQMELTLAVYDEDSALIRQETTYLRILVNGAMATVTNWATTGTPNVSGRYLVGETEVSIGATFDMAAFHGATPKQVVLSMSGMLDGSATFTADQLTKSGTVYTTPTVALGIAAYAGQHPQEMALLDSRGMWSYYTGEDLLAPIAYAYSRPSIPLFSAERYGEIIDDDQHVIGYQTDPTGNKVWFSASAAIASVGGANALSWVLQLTSRADGSVLTASGTATGTSLVWSDDRDLIGDTIDPEIVWDAALIITDSAGFTATAYDVVPAGKAVLHLPACKNGIAFGGLSTATAENPLGEMFYPFHAYAGIYGVTGWSLKEEDTGGVWLDGQKVYRKTLYARIATAGQAVDIPFPDGLQRIVHMQGILYTDDTINRTRPLSWYYNTSLNASLWHGGSANVTVQANGEIGDAFVTIWYTKTAGIVIIKQPEDATVALGGTATFTVKALGSPAYQWQQSTPPTATVGPDELLHVTDALAAPVTALEAAVTPVQSGSGDPSPSNVRPITGWTGAKLFVSDEEPVLGDGQNLMMNTLEATDTSVTANRPKLAGQSRDSGIYSGNTSVRAQHGIRITNSAATQHVRFYHGNNSTMSMHGLAAGETYTYSFDYSVKLYSSQASSTYYFRFVVYDLSAASGTINHIAKQENIETFTSAGTKERTGHAEITFTLSTGAQAMYILIGTSTQTGMASGDYIELRNIKLEKGDTSTDWCPAPEDLATPVDVSFGQTVYGGVLDATNGTLIVTWKAVTINDLSWSYQSANTRFAAAITDGKSGYAARAFPVIASAYVSITDGRGISSVPDNAIYGVSTNTPTVYIKTTDYTTVEAFKAAMGDQTILYPLETYPVVSVTPATVQLLSGENYVWTDTGDASMTYYTTGTPTWSDISGETANTLSVTASLEAAVKEYRCQLTEGSAAATSDAAGIVLS